MTEDSGWVRERGKQAGEHTNGERWGMGGRGRVDWE